MPVFKVVYCQAWDESELGWGIRPDGFSLHKSKEAHEKYLEEFYAGQPKEVPAEYSRVGGDIYACKVDGNLYAEVQEKTNRRFWSNNLPERL